MSAQSRQVLERGVPNAPPDTTSEGLYFSLKGFTIAEAKLTRYCLDPEKKHSGEFFEVGYGRSDHDLLFQHIEEGFDLSKKIGERTSPRGEKQFCIPIRLGVTKKRIFSTAWQLDAGAVYPKMITAYLDRRTAEEDK